jgi:hypothetical protein
MKSFSHSQKPPKRLSMRMLQICLLGSISGLMLACGCGGSSKNIITIKAFIDDKDVLKIQGDKVWWEHGLGAFPGDPKGGNQPTFINDVAWRPQWGGSNSIPFEALAPAFRPRYPAQVKLTKLSGRGDAAISDLPTPANNGTLSVYFNDEEGGADWYEVAILWE